MFVCLFVFGLGIRKSVWKSGSLIGVVFLSEGEAEEEPVVKQPKENAPANALLPTQQPEPAVLFELPRAPLD